MRSPRPKGSSRATPGRLCNDAQRIRRACRARKHRAESILREGDLRLLGGARRRTTRAGLVERSPCARRQQDVHSAGNHGAVASSARAEKSRTHGSCVVVRDDDAQSERARALHLEAPAAAGQRPRPRRWTPPSVRATIDTSAATRGLRVLFSRARPHGDRRPAARRPYAAAVAARWRRPGGGGALGKQARRSSALKCCVNSMRIGDRFARRPRPARTPSARQARDGRLVETVPGALLHGGGRHVSARRRGRARA